MNFDEASEYLHGLTRLGIKLGNERFEALLGRLGNPHAALQAVHVAGTKGKGSTCVFASSILRAAGYRVGTYLSPYVYDLRERVQVDGEMIARDDFARLATWIRSEAEQLAESRPDLGPTTEFEFKTALGFCYFAEQQVDYAVIEVGLGGRLDATNVLPDPLVSVITNIGFDHMNLLGNTLWQIAGEKAGIVKPGGICVTGAQAPEALERIAADCAARNARLAHVVPQRDWGVDGDGFWVKTPRRSLTGLRLGVRGEFQQANAALAAHALDQARGAIMLSDDAVRRGLSAARVPGRLEIVRSEAPTVVVDAAHNAMAAAALGTALAGEFGASERPLALVVGMSKGHEPDEFLTALLSGFDLSQVTLVATQPSFRPRPADEIANAARRLGVVECELIESAELAAARALDIALAAGEDALVVVTGSFFTIGELPPEAWQQIFEQRGLNETIPADILALDLAREQTLPL